MNGIPFWGIGAPPILGFILAGIDVHWGYEVAFDFDPWPFGSVAFADLSLSQQEVYLQPDAHPALRHPDLARGLGRKPRNLGVAQY